LRENRAHFIILAATFVEHYRFCPEPGYQSYSAKAKRWGGGSMWAKKQELEAMLVDDLWSLHEKIGEILATRIKAQKQELEERLAILSRGMDVAAGSSAPFNERPRRKYSVVLRNMVWPRQASTLVDRRHEVWKRDRRISNRLATRRARQQARAINYRLRQGR
jgi:DNA-binding protein H-NS